MLPREFILLFREGAGWKLSQHLPHVLKTGTVLKRFFERSPGRGWIAYYALHLRQVLYQPNNVFVAVKCRLPEGDGALQISGFCPQRTQVRKSCQILRIEFQNSFEKFGGLFEIAAFFARDAEGVERLPVSCDLGSEFFE